MNENCSKSLKTIGEAFWGNGFIHLNIAEIHEGDIGGQKTRAYFANQSSKMSEFTLHHLMGVQFSKRI